MKTRTCATISLICVSLLIGAACIAQERHTITHGPILGRLGEDHVGVWARTSRPGPLRVRYGLSAGKLDHVSDPVQTKLDSDNTGWVLLKGLEPNTTYFYRAEAQDSQNSETLSGSFRTLPRSKDFQNPEHNPNGLFNFRFEFACGNSPRPQDPPRPTFVTMLRELQGEIDFAILNGDWLYEKKRDFPVDQWTEQVGVKEDKAPNIVNLAPSIVGVWENYKDYLENDPNLAAWHRQVPSFFTFDDHEILGDVNGCGEIGFRNKKAVFRDIGVKAWYDYLGWSNEPYHKQETYFGKAGFEANSDILTDSNADFSKINFDQTANLHVHWGGQLAGEKRVPDGPGDPNAGVYEIVNVLDKHRLRIRPAAKASKQSAYSIGRLSYSLMRVSNCDFLFLDTRSHRELYDIDNLDKPGVSVLGKKQKDWIFKTMRESDAEFFFVLSSVNFMIPHVGNKGKGTSNKSESWTGYLDEREHLINFWDELGKPVFVLTGDLHNSLAIKITDRVWEFASGPHSSGNHTAKAEGDRPPNGIFQYDTRPFDIRWSSYLLPGKTKTYMPHYCVVQVNNVFSNKDAKGNDLWIEFPKPHVVFQYYDGLTGQLRYAESIFAEN